MTLGKWGVLIPSLGFVAALVACSSSSKNTVAPPPPRVQPITVTVGTTPGTLFVNDTASISATVANDSANGGVMWKCAPAGSCGTFSSNQSASGATVTYKAPGTTGSVTITATSATNTSISASAPPITINAASGIEITLSKPAQWSLAASATAGISATVANDPANAGVTWSCAPASSCGLFSPSQTASNAATSFTAPAAAGPVVITATSVSDNAISASTTVTVGTSGMLADGNYVFTLSGSDDTFSGENLFVAAGVIVVKGGVITGGEQDWGDFFTAASDQINGVGSSITTTADGNLQINLQTCSASDCTHTDTSIGVNGVETLNGTLVSPSRMLISEYDSFASASGTLDLQTSAATPSGSYSFFVAGEVFLPGPQVTVPLEIGGVLNIDSPQTISGAGSVFDANVGGSATQFQNESFAVSVVSSPDSFGRVAFKLNAVDSGDFPQIILAGYIVDATHIRLVETSDAFNGFIGGTALAQTNPGTFSSSSVAGNSYVVKLSGLDNFGNLQLAGLLTTNADGTVGGTINYNDLTGTGVQAPSSVTGGTYTVDPTGRVTITGLTDGIVNLNLQLYLDGNGNAPVISMDSSDAIAGPGFQQSGGGSFIADSFSGAYAMSATGSEIPVGTASFNQSEFDATGPVTATGTGAFSGFADLNAFSGSPFQGIPAFTVQTPDLTVTGAVTPSPNGVFTGTITGLDVDTNSNQDNFTYYLVDSTRAVAIETDPNQSTLGSFEVQPQP